ncbi:MAG: single-stranded DNA-binding protein [Anaerolineaceae bacterium]|nr:MAG: single-stranded DNA-binding protein [Anaerolineaceae bacterium]
MNFGLNKVMLIGWLDAEPEIRQTPNGRQIASFTLAVPRSWVSLQGEHREETEWFNVVAWGGLAEICDSYLAQDRQVYVEGRLQTRRWQDGQGRTHFRTEVVARDIIALTSQNDETFVDDSD